MTATPDSPTLAPLILANWKSHKRTAEASAWLQAVAKAKLPSVGTIAMAPAFPQLEMMAEMVDELKLPVKLAVQDLSPFPEGNYTGAVSTANLKDLPIEFAILGHSERRRYFHETHQEVANKVEQALEAGITPVVCVDEPYHQAQAAAIAPELYGRCVVAYEPLEAIGSGLPQSVDEVAEVFESIQSTWTGAMLIYGGSVSAENVSSYLRRCQGVLVATHSLEATDFVEVVKAARLT